MSSNSQSCAVTPCRHDAYLALAFGILAGETRPRTPLRQPTRRSRGVGDTCVATALRFAAHERLAPSRQEASIPYPRAPCHGRRVTPRPHDPQQRTGRVHNRNAPRPASSSSREVSLAPHTDSEKDRIPQAAPGTMARAPVSDLLSRTQHLTCVPQHRLPPAFGQPTILLCAILSSWPYTRPPGRIDACLSFSNGRNRSV